MAHVAGCACGSEFLFEVADLETGIVRDRLHPVAADWQTTLNEPGQGTLTLATGDVAVGSIWPHRNVVYIARIAGGTATPENPIAEFAGIIEQFNASAEGTTQVGMLGIEHYLNHRVIPDSTPGQVGGGGYHVTDRSQTLIGRDLVEFAETNGIQLSAAADPSSFTRTRNFESWEYKNIGEAVRQLTEVRDGPDWTTDHVKADGRWSSVMTFTDDAGVVRNLTLRSDIEVHRYGLEVDATNQATHVIALGEGEEDAMLVAKATDTEGPYVQFDATPAWKDVSEIETLRQHANGYLDLNQEPYASPSISITGVDLDPEQIELGDVVNLDLSFGAVTYRGQARIITRAWRLSDVTVDRTFELVPLTRASSAILSQVPSDDCRECT